ncbi:hypothetical protein PMAYCL1PPCAC_02013, partial [Pristionchus mayeri]
GQVLPLTHIIEKVNEMGVKAIVVGTVCRKIVRSSITADAPPPVAKELVAYLHATDLHVYEWNTNQGARTSVDETSYASCVHIPIIKSYVSQ